MANGVFAVRSVQLDLARQMETVDYICGFIDLMAQYGYNSLTLYLEGRIRTPTFPYPAQEASYTPEEMSEVVRHAARRRMDVVPVVSTLGHVEQFLQFPELRELAELREGIPGRFGNALMNFCPSQEATYRFLEQYLAEVAAIFPSPYLHAGCDEVFDFGLCSACRKRVLGGETEADIFVRHLRRVHEIVTGKLGKRMIIWDDMLEEYPAALEKLPRDIIMCVWQYDALADITRNHFGPRQSDRRLANFRRLGFDFWIAPCEGIVRNTASLTEHALPHRPAGGLVTVWDHSTSLMLENYPSLAFAGRLWEKRAAGNSAETDEQIFKQAGAELMGNSDERFLQALWLAKNIGGWSGCIPAEPVHRGALSPYLFGRDNSLAILIGLLEEGSKKVKSETGAAVLTNLLCSLRHERLQHALQDWSHRLYQCLSGGSRAALTGLVAEGRAFQARLREIRETFLPLADRTRSLRLTPPIHRHWDSASNGLDKLVQQAERGEAVTLFAVTYVLPDFYSCQRVTWDVQRGDGQWETVYQGVPKPVDGDLGDRGIFSMEVPLAGSKPVLRARIVTYGHGGIGLAWIESRGPEGRFVPNAISRAEGKLGGLSNLFRNDSLWCWLGEENTEAAFHLPDLARQKHIIEFELGRQGQ